MNYLFLALPILALSISHSPIAQESENSDSVDSADSQKTEEQAPEKAYLKDKSVWISDEFLVPLRSTPCARCTIVHRGLKSGTKLQLLEMVDGWGHLITNRGVEGWAEEQYLVDQPIARIRVKTQEKELAALKQRNIELEEKVGELTQAANAVRGELDNSQDNQKSLTTELAEIREISSDAIALSEQNQQLVKNNHMLQRENDSLKANVDDLQKDQRNESFLYGGLTVFLGAILVILIPKLRGRKRFSEWQ
ncbi:Bacterial SH3 domain-like protein [gamma proteobacterium HTCC2207]|jgi:SH3 domain protein|uniref:Bacterial SH3 domain-like protein n=1 Tax=gamma proteobacterium HTCC2207 TaxID=314287 RepID=Q1YRT5_9GAMM|nr:Bacterial SH3 domain-like protein [gamma proteobacterium HTCC2207]